MYNKSYLTHTDYEGGILMNTISDCMSTNIVTIEPNQSIQEAANLMKHYDIGSIPVVQGKQLIGIITDRDITLRSTAEALTSRYLFKNVCQQI